jgi:hypothetical protein
VDPDDPAIQALAQDIRERGLLQPIVITRDKFILSGHRRHAACKLAGKKQVDCEVVDISVNDPGFEELLCAYNQQRVKSIDEIAREQAVMMNPESAYQALIEYRKEQSTVKREFMAIEGTKKRKKFSKAKKPMLDCVLGIIESQRDYWPLSDRSIHYCLLSEPPLRNANRPDSRYRNDRVSYQDLTDVLTRSRLADFIPFDAFADPTRTVCTWDDVSPSVEQFFQREFDGFLKNFWRDLQRSQPNHIEIVGEKNTVEASIKPVAMRYCIPYTLGRGYSSLDPRYQMVKRFRASGKSKLIVLMMSDFDPEGCDIPNSFGKSLRDDFGVEDVRIVRVCLTYEQVMERNLAQTFDMKKNNDPQEG